MKAVVLVLLLPVVQLVAVGRWGGPELALVAVVVLARTAGTGAVLGFVAGLAADVAPPAEHTIGIGTLVLTFAGYFAGRLSSGRERPVFGERSAAERSAASWVGMLAVVAVAATWARAGLDLAVAGEPVALGDLAWLTGWNLVAVVVVAAVAARLSRRRQVAGRAVLRRRYA
ncbi:hypothetical protein Aph01nite_78040 [Acrocarpospora phusangensis]|uniref:Rod shape-determining protein MreD n=1 Tax=Acrocarpospora phusangensis TaxID=1070424 RepID=A0A919UQ65_9ACTN|nr:hypothetical protein [Acrocarpospora phusangensis]GIH29494.1 hypothetical protein Aph01nite_78040 [Acrocarpospora phusangensis]